jgi:hypothetical protein
MTRCWWAGVCLLVACSSPKGSSVGEPGVDLRAGGDLAVLELPETDTADRQDLRIDVGAAFDAADDAVSQPPTRTFLYRGMGGVSMGASAFNFHVHHPGRLDMVAALGGYINYHYLQDFFLNMIYGGFCDLATLLAHIDEINNPDHPALQCSPVQPRHPWEFAVGFNHWHYDTSGITTDRDFFFYVTEGIFTALGNLAYYNPEHPYLPPGVPASWVQPGDKAGKCAAPVHVGKPFNYNAEYNPLGEFDLITFCDGEEPVPGGKDNPDFETLMGSYDPTQPHTRPVGIMLAVDLNGNGVRDYHEPIAINAFERFSDVGTDGCADALEDGAGGCTGGGQGDANGDNYHMLTNPFGTQGNFFWDDGEPYNDFGVDGVAGTGDFGEGDGSYTRNPRLQKMLDESVIEWLRTAPQEDIDAVDVVMDGGIRDALHALTATYPVFKELQARVPDSREYSGYTEFEDSLLPGGGETLLLVEQNAVDWSRAGVGKNVIVKYGDPDASAAQIKAGDGKHLGSDLTLLNRAALMLLVPLRRWPGLDWEPCADQPGSTHNRTFYSPAMKNRYAYSISLPPCYETTPEGHPGYPLYVYLPGHGLSAESTIAGGVAFNILMQSGQVPKFILVVPEGQCCDVDLETKTRYCVCRNDPDNDQQRLCMDPSCTGPEAECAMLPVPKANLREECNGGHFFANQVSNLFGDTELAQEMRFEDMLLDLLDELEAKYRLRQPESWPDV